MAAVSGWRRRAVAVVVAGSVVAGLAGCAVGPVPIEGGIVVTGVWLVPDSAPTTTMGAHEGNRLPSGVAGEVEVRIITRAPVDPVTGCAMDLPGVGSSRDDVEWLPDSGADGEYRLHLHTAGLVPSQPGDRFRIRCHVRADGTTFPLAVEPAWRVAPRGWFAIEPGSLAFPDRAVGEAPAAMTVHVSNGGTPGEVLRPGPVRLEQDGSAFSVVDTNCWQFPLDPGEGCDLVVRFAADRVGRFTGRLVLPTADDRHRAWVALTGVGTGGVATGPATSPPTSSTPAPTTACPGC